MTCPGDHSFVLETIVEANGEPVKVIYRCRLCEEKFVENLEEKKDERLGNNP